MSPQAMRYLTLVGIFALSGYLVWLGDEWPIRIVPAHYVGYLLAVIGVAGLLGFNIWYGGLLDKRREADAAGNTLRGGIPILTATAMFAGIISAVYLFVPISRAEQDGLSIRKYRITADFPCRPKRSKQALGVAKTGEEISQTTLVCSEGVVVYTLSATEFSEQTFKALPAEVWAKNTLEGLRSQPHFTLKSSSQLSYRNFPAIRMHALDDSREPPVDRTRLMVLTDAGTVMIGVSWPSSSPEPASSFTNSLSISEK